MKNFEELRFNCPSFTTGMHNAPKCGAKAYQDKHTTWLQPCYEKHLCPMIYWINILEKQETDKEGRLVKSPFTLLGILVMFLGFILIMASIFNRV
jgi:hypothetical protein